MSGCRYRIDGAVGRQPNPVFCLIQRFAPYSRSERECDRLLHRSAASVFVALIAQPSTGEPAHGRQDQQQDIARKPGLRIPKKEEDEYRDDQTRDRAGQGCFETLAHLTSKIASGRSERGSRRQERYPR